MGRRGYPEDTPRPVRNPSPMGAVTVAFPDSIFVWRAKFTIEHFQSPITFPRTRSIPRIPQNCAGIGSGDMLIAVVTD